MVQTFDLGEKVEVTVYDYFNITNIILKGVIDRKIILNQNDHYMVKYDDESYSTWLEPHEITKMGPVNPKCECGNKDNPRGQGHSHWCPSWENL